MPSLGTQDPDATDYSSSFGDTASQNGDASSMSDAEVESEFYADNDFSNLFNTRKKKLSSHWRRFIHPLVWRCKWTELRLKELERQAIIYSQEIVESGGRKLFGLDLSTSNLCSKSLPLLGECIKKRAFKRRKRKQVEAMVDLASYMSSHHLFSYIENESSDMDGSVTADGIGQVGPCVGTEDLGIMNESIRDNENPLEHVLFRIERIQSRIHGLKTHLDMVMFDNDVKFSSWENLRLLVPYAVPASSTNNSPRFSTIDDSSFSASIVCTPQHMSIFEIGDLVIPDISCHGEATHVPDIMESTMGLLTTADVDVHQPQSKTL
ncbi:hypothetical protein Droror1_Dr00002525 [Drosera rotundifolia]